jgi:CheY-like chemotaxis protein
MRACLDIRWEDEVGQQIYLYDEVISIGRTLGNRVVLGESTVSRNHAQILREADCYWLFDLGSANGTLLNDQRLNAHQAYPLSDDDEIRIGPFKLRFGRQIIGPEGLPPSELRVLLAEDNRINQQVALRLLQKVGYTADVVNNGREAVEAVREKTYDVILMDLEMPEMDGLTATQVISDEWEQLSLQRHQTRTRPWIIALTAYATQEDRDRCRRAGMNGYLTKPIRIAELERALQQCGVLILTDSTKDQGTWITAAEDNTGIQGLS